MRPFISLVVLFAATADTVCTPTLTHTNTILTIGSGYTRNVLYVPGTNIAVGVGAREIYDFDVTATAATIAPNVRAGNAASGTWAGDQDGANARFTTEGGIMKPDGTTVYFALTNALAQVALSGNYPVAELAGHQADQFACAEGDGTTARLNAVWSPAIADVTGDTLLVPVYGCHRLALVETNSPHAVTWKAGTGNSATATAAGYGTSAPINKPRSVTPWRNRFYGSDYDGKTVVVIYPAANWQQVIITTGSTPQSTANNIPFDSTYHSNSAFGYGAFSTWSNCWLHLFQQYTQVGHIVDPDGGNMFLLAGIAPNSAFFASADLNGNVWVSRHAGVAKDLGKYSIAYTGCPAMSPHKCKWGYMTATATATLQEVPPRTRTATPPMTTPAPMTTDPATTTAVSASASASSGGAATISATTISAATTAAATTAAATTAATTTAAATTAAATSTAATTAVVGTTAAATAAAVTTTVATSTTAAAGSTSSSSGSTGNGASSVTVVALGLMTMVLAMF